MNLLSLYFPLFCFQVVVLISNMCGALMNTLLEVGREDNNRRRKYPSKKSFHIKIM